MLCEMQSVSSRIWTRVVVSIFYDDNHYTTDTIFFLIHYKFSIRFTLELFAGHVIDSYMFFLKNNYIPFCS